MSSSDTVFETFFCVFPVFKWASCSCKNRLWFPSVSTWAVVILYFFKLSDGFWLLSFCRLICFNLDQSKVLSFGNGLRHNFLLLLHLICYQRILSIYTSLAFCYLETSLTLYHTVPGLNNHGIESLGNIVKKGENAGHQHYHLFMPLFQKIGGILYYRFPSVCPSVCLSAQTWHENLTFPLYS